MRCDAVSVRKSKSARTAFCSASSTSSRRARSSRSSPASGASSPGMPALVMSHPPRHLSYVLVARRGDLAAWGWFGGIALLVAAPLLGGGYLLLLDFPSGPRFPHVPVFPLPSSGVVG